MEHPDLTFCREALKRASLVAVSNEAPFSRRWLQYIRDGQIPHPSINRIAELKALIEDRPDLFPPASRTRAKGRSGRHSGIAGNRGEPGGGSR